MRRAPAGEVLGPLPGWALAAVAAVGAVTRWHGGPPPAGALRSPVPGHPRALVAAVPLEGAALLLVALLGAGLLVLLAGRAHRQDEWRLGVPVGVLALVVVASSVAGGLILRDDAAASGAVPALAARGGTTGMLLRVVAEPRPIARGWHVPVRVEQAGGQRVRERAAIVLEEDPPALGERWWVQASARPLPEGGYGAWLAQQHARGVLDPVVTERLGPGGAASRGTEWLRDRVRIAATRHLDDRRGGLLVGFVSGDTRLLPAADRAAMQATSLTHLTAVSGTNVAIVAGGVLGLAALLRLPPGAARLAVAVVVPWFAFLTRFQPSVLRAGAMALLLLLAAARGQLRDARHALALVVLVLVLLDPRLGGALGLLLSAVATAGVLVLAPAVRARLPATLSRRLATAAAVTLGAQLAVLPLLLATFGELPLVSVPANLLAVPAAVVAATLAFIGTALAVVSVEAAAVAFALAGPGAAVVLAVAEGLAGRGASVTLVNPASIVAALAGAAWLLSQHRGPVRTALAVVTVVAVAVAGAPAVGGALPPRVLTVTAIDVGQGDAFLVESPRARVLVDAGEGEAAARWLRRHGRRHLDLVVVTHPHLDHVGGVPEVLRRVRVGTVWASLLPTALPQAAEVYTVAAARGVPVRVPAVGDRAEVGDLTIEVLHPPPGRPYRSARSELNETSTVLRVHHGGRRVLLTGDIELRAQADLLAAGTPLSAELLAVPHHGAGTTDPAFLAAVAPVTALISVGAHNRHGHPDPTTLSALEDLGVEVRRTDLEGTIRVEVPSPRSAPAAGPASPLTSDAWVRVAVVAGATRALVRAPRTRAGAPRTYEVGAVPRAGRPPAVGDVGRDRGRWGVYGARGPPSGGWMIERGVVHG